MKKKEKIIDKNQGQIYKNTSKLISLKENKNR